MNLKKRLKKFFALNRGADDGFTLVELIVVIAILGILAGVGTVAYSGYIKKAQTAADEILLDSLNTAFAAACIENGVDSTQVSASGITIGSDKTVAKTDIVVTDPSAKATAIQDAFGEYYEGGEFKVYTKLTYANGMFVGANANGGATVTLPGGATLSLTAEQVALLKASTYSKNIGGLMTQVDEIGGLVTGLMIGDGSNPAAAQALLGFMQSEDYLTKAIVAMGGTVAAGSDLAALQTQYGEIVGAFKENQAISQAAAQLGIDPDDFDWTNTDHTNAYNALIDSVGNEVDKNILVLGVAQSAATQSKDGAMAIINSANPKADLLAAMTGQSGTGVANGMGNAALVYGAFTAYASSDAATDAAKAALANSSDPTAVFDVLTGDELTAFQNYMKTEQGQTDMDACIAAMGVIDSTATDADAVNGVLSNGFADNDFVAALEELLK